MCSELFKLWYSGTPIILTATPKQQSSAIPRPKALVRIELCYIDFHSNQTPEERPPLCNGHNVILQGPPLLLSLGRTLILNLHLVS